MTAHAVSASSVPIRLTQLMADYQELHRCAPGQEAARGQRFNAFLIDAAAATAERRLHHRPGRRR
ncbi:hypothetical protein [Streptomyces mirabilis]|uniref:hypothetical protein n=1 Tax=Streptomyces mirabilis TaxID=68239 RepID=UPI0036933901